MLHVTLDGDPLSTAQGQRVLVSPWTGDLVNTSGPQTIGTSAQLVMDTSAVSFQSWWVRFKNTSTNSARIAIGFTNAITIANAGLILEPGDVEIIENFNTPLFAISSLAGGLLLRFAMRTN